MCVCVCLSVKKLYLWRIKAPYIDNNDDEKNFDERKKIIFRYANPKMIVKKKKNLKNMSIKQQQMTVFHLVWLELNA